jgi:hypothetical protein
MQCCAPSGPVDVTLVNRTEEAIAAQLALEGLHELVTSASVHDTVVVQAPGLSTRCRGGHSGRRSGQRGGDERTFTSAREALTSRR